MTGCAFRLAVLLFLVLATCPVQAAERGPQGEIRVGVFAFEPFNFIDERGVAQGLYPDLLREIVRDERWTFKFVPGSWAEGLERLQRQEIDLLVSVAYSQERAEIVDFSYESVAELWGQVFVRPEGKSLNIDDLAGRRVAVMRKDISAGNFSKTAEKLGVRCEIREFASHAEAFAAVQKGEADAGVAPQHFGLRHADEYNLVASSILFSPFSIYFASKKGTQHELLSHIDAHLARWKRDKDSFYYERLNYWSGNPASGTPVPPWLISTLLVAVAAVFASTAFTLLLKKTVRRTTGELQASEERYRVLIDLAVDGILLGSREGIVTEANRYMCTMLGMAQEDIIGKHITALPFSQENLRKNPFRLDLLQNGEIVKGERTLIRPDGSAVSVEMRSKLMPDGTYQSIYRNITERKQAEEQRQKLETQLAQAQKMEAIGTLAGGIAHDFNNILSAILGYAEIAKEDSPAGSPVARDLAEILKAGFRARDLVKQILAFSRQAKAERILLYPAGVVKEAIKMLRPSLPSTIEIRQNIALSAGPVMADPTQLHQILINLCTNAYHAMEKTGGILTLSLKNTALSREDLAREPYLEPGEFVQLSVSDTGSGIAPDIRERIFEPYFTTKETGKGSGMGLAIVHGIAKSHGGYLSCYSEPGEGTVFHLFLPMLHGGTAVETVTRSPAPGGNEHILFIDDEEMLAKMSRIMLERLGYTVTVKTNSLEALAIFRDQPDRFDIVITDQTMPGMTGVDLAERLLQIRPDLPVILCTGFSTLISEDTARTIGIRELAIKPLAKGDIARLIRKVLDETAEAAPPLTT